MMQSLFAYGTLQLPEILERVIGRHVQGIPATLADYRSGLVARANFPGIVPKSGSIVEGSLITGFSPHEIQLLDQYEGELYRRILVTVLTQDTDAHPKQCWVYVIVPWAKTRVTETPWTIQWYREQGAKGRLTYRS